MIGVSVIICCYNSSGKLPETLNSLAKQIIPECLSWEVLIIDNGSTDNTAETALICWEVLKSTAPFRVVFEKKQGLSHAREKGISESAYSFLLFCDDDNSLAPDYIKRGFDCLIVNNNTALIGGKGIAQIEGLGEVPVWFERYAYQYAVGPQANVSKDITVERGFVYGAGCFLRKSAYESLKAAGFRYILTGRKGDSLISGEDNELGYALSLMGFVIYYNEELTFTHVLSEKRLKWSYLKKLKQAVAYSSVLLTPYIERRKEYFFKSQSSFSWEKQVMCDTLYLVNDILRYPFASTSFKMDIILDAHARIGRIKALFQFRTFLKNRHTWLPWLLK
jgi:glycosyltransferase involved in cell wall biosynthesis